MSLSAGPKIGVKIAPKDDDMGSVTVEYCDDADGVNDIYNSGTVLLKVVEKQ